MSATKACPECGARVPTDAPLGLCPRCLMNAAASETAFNRPIEKQGAAPISPPAPGCPEILQAIRELDLVPAQDLDRLEALAGVDPAQLARSLVEDKKLTHYQAGALLQGKARGLLIGQYLVEDRLGVGGMGVVFKARHRSSGRVVALKILPPSFAREPDAITRFRREFQIASRLNHPNLVAAIEASEDRGVHYLTMEYIPGYDLDRLVSQGGPMALKLALHSAIQVARGLEAAHAQGVIHRDIKPGNIMIDQAGAVRVLDLGLARVIEASNQFGRTAVGSLTQTGSYMGTVDFLAPEQADNAKSADARADIYSLACTLYFLLTGKPPFPGDSVLKRLIAHQDRPAPSLRAARPEIPEALEDIYLSMMAKRPADRPQSMSEVVMALEACRTSSREAGDASADLKTFARTIMKRAPVRGRRAPDASVFARPSPNSGGLLFDPDLRLEDLVGDYREEAGHNALPEEKLPPIVSRPLAHRPRRRRSAIPYGPITLALIGLAAAWYAFRSESTPEPAPSKALAAVSTAAPSAPVSVTPKSTTPKLGRVLFVDEFNDPTSGWDKEPADQRFKKTDQYHGYVDGLYCIDANKLAWLDRSWACPKKGFPEFSCELLGRVYGDKSDAYGYLALVIDGAGHGLQIMINTQSEITVNMTTTNGEPKRLGSRHDPAIKTGPIEFNRIVVNVSQRRAEIFVNGKRVFDPVILDWDAIPADLSVGVSCTRPNIHVEFDRIEVREITDDSATANGGASAQQTPKTPEFQPLFNGKDLTGWAGAVDDYQVRDGLLSCKPGKRAVIYEPLQRSDFVARVEFRLAPGAESGLLIRYPGQGDGAFSGMCEIQILDDSHPSYANFDPRVYNGSVWGMAAARRGFLKADGGWNVQEVTVRGSTIKVELNGAVILDTDLAPIHVFHKPDETHPGKDRASGFLGVQSGLGTNQGNVQYRKIEIKELNEPRKTSASIDRGPFVPLFNGKDLTGWGQKGGLTGHWRVRDQSLEFDNRKHDETQQLMTDREFLDFAIRLEFQTERGTDTGVDLIDFEPNGVLRNCTEVDIHHTPVRGEPDDNVGEIWTWGTGIPVNCLSRNTVDLKGDNSWRTMEIQRQQGLLSVTVNGRKLANRVQVAPGPSRIGFEGEVGRARFRNIEVIELPQP